LKSFRNIDMSRRNKTKTKKAVVVAIKQPKRSRRQRRQRRAPRQKITQIGRVLRGAGQSIGSYFGMPSVGRNVAAGISRVFGQGDYMMNSPLRNSLTSAGPPSFSPLTSGFRIRHREYIKDIQSSVGFNSSIFRINPGLPDLFPWLSSVANNFEEYKIHGMIVWLNTSSATAVSSTNTALGIWGVVTQYDAAEPDFTDKQQCENYVGAQSTVPSNSIMHGIECMPGSNVLDKFFVRTGDLSADLDIKFYDLGKVEVFTQGSQAVSTIGELWVSYDIEFTKPRLSQSGLNGYDSYTITNHTNALPFGPASGQDPDNNSSGYTTLIPALNQVVWNSSSPAGVYLITCMWRGNTTSGGCFVGTPTLTNLSLISSVALPNPYLVPQTTPVAQCAYFLQVYKPQSGQAVLTFQVGNVLPPWNSAVGNDFMGITLLPSSFVSKSLTKLTKLDVRNIKLLLQQVAGNPDVLRLLENPGVAISDEEEKAGDKISLDIID